MSISEIGRRSLHSHMDCGKFEMRKGDQAVVHIIDKPEFVMGENRKPVRNPLLEARFMTVVSGDTVLLEKFDDSDSKPEELIGDRINNAKLWMLPNGITKHYYGEIIFSAPSCLVPQFPDKDDIPF